MKLLRTHIISAETCGGLLDGFHVNFRNIDTHYQAFEPLCLIGHNGSGKSQFLQVLVEILQSVIHAVHPGEERAEANPQVQFELEYLIQPKEADNPIHVRVSRKKESRKLPVIILETYQDGEWQRLDLSSDKVRSLLPSKIVGYTSGDNETLSFPFLVSRSGYADEVGRKALSNEPDKSSVLDTRLMLIDYATNLEVLVSNLLLSTEKQRESLLEEAKLKDLQSFRCVIQLAHAPAPKISARRKGGVSRKGIQLTQELETYIDQLKRCATCYHYDEKSETYTFDFWVDKHTKAGFKSFWSSTLELYTSLHKLSMLNDLVLPKKSRERYQRTTNERRFATRLPEPQDEDKVFRFEQVTFDPKRGGKSVDYVSLSDGEHQLAQLFGTMCMISAPNVLFILDEPESHFNPQWRVKFMSRILDLPTKQGNRSDGNESAQQECFVTTHAPFVPSDMSRERVFIFKKDGREIHVQRPQVETFGSTFDSILEECFGVRPPISQISRDEIDVLMKSTNPEEIRDGLKRLGDSVEKVLILDRLENLESAGE